MSQVGHSGTMVYTCGLVIISNRCTCMCSMWCHGYHYVHNILHLYLFDINLPSQSSHMSISDTTARKIQAKNGIPPSISLLICIALACYFAVLCINSYFVCATLNRFLKYVFMEVSRCRARISLDTVTVVESDVFIILLYSSDSRTLILRLLVIFSKHPRWAWICDHINQFGYTIYNEKYFSDDQFSCIVCILTWRA